MLRILITGGTGYLGSNLARSLLESGNEVVIALRQSSRTERIGDIKNQLNLLYVDRELSLRELEIDVVVHCATNYGRKGELSEVTKANIEFPLSLLEQLRTDNILFVNIGTSLPKDFNSYSTSKHEFVSRCLKKFPKLKFLNLVFQQFYGPGDDSIYSNVIRQLMHSEHGVELTAGNQQRDLIFISDAVRAIRKCIKYGLTEDFFYDEVDVGSGRAVVFREVIEKIAKLVGVPPERLLWGKKDFRDPEIFYSAANTQELRELSWSPLVDLDSGLQMLVDYEREIVR